jgi:hypothetical protein
MENSHQNITIPTEIINGSLSLEEIGSLIVLMSLPYCDDDYGWGTNEQFNKTLKHFIEEEIVIPNNDDNSVEIDLTWIDNKI